MNRDQYNALIERLADKTLSFGCKFTTKSIFNPDQEHTVVDIEMNYEGDRELLPPFEEVTDEDGIVYPVTKIKNILGHPILIGDILQKIMLEYGKKEGDSLYPYYGVVKQHVQLAEKWAYCGYNKSLRTILEESEWEYPKQESEYAELPIGRPSERYALPSKGMHTVAEKQLKSPAKELFSFLDTLFPIK